jgi:hypothetical protein
MNNKVKKIADFVLRNLLAWVTTGIMLQIMIYMIWWCMIPFDICLTLIAALYGLCLVIEVGLVVTLSWIKKAFGLLVQLRSPVRKGRLRFPIVITKL